VDLGPRSVDLFGVASGGRLWKGEVERERVWGGRVPIHRIRALRNKRCCVRYDACCRTGMEVRMTSVPRRARSNWTLGGAMALALCSEIVTLNTQDIFAVEILAVNVLVKGEWWSIPYGC